MYLDFIIDFAKEGSWITIECGETTYSGTIVKISPNLIAIRTGNAIIVKKDSDITAPPIVDPYKELSIKRTVREIERDRNFSADDSKQMQDMANEHFYSLDKRFPMNTILCELQFLNKHDVTYTHIISQIQALVKEEYGLDMQIDADGRIVLPNKDIQYVEKVIKNNFESIVTLKKDCTVQIVVSTKRRIDINKEEIKKILDDNNLFMADFKLLPNEIHVKVNSFVPRDMFIGLGFRYIMQLSRYCSPTRRDNLLPIEGLTIKSMGDEGYAYVVQNKKNISLQKNNAIIKEINETLNESDFKRAKTLHVFRYFDEANDDQLHDFKTNVETMPGIKFNFRTSTLSINVSSKGEYRRIFEDIKSRFPELQFTNKPYLPSYSILPKAGVLQYRIDAERTMRKLIKEQGIPESYCIFDHSKKYEKIWITYKYSTNNNHNDKELFFRAIRQIASQYQSSINMKIKNEDGITLCEFKIDEQLDTSK